VSRGCCATVGREEPCHGGAVTHVDGMRVVWGVVDERRSEVAMGRFNSILGSTGHDLVSPSIIWVRFSSAQPVGRFQERRIFEKGFVKYLN
jgi:hypothetical protein